MVRGYRPKIAEARGSRAAFAWHLRDHRLLRDDNAGYVDPLDMLAELREENKAPAVHFLEAPNVWDGQRDVATASVIEVWIDENERRTGFLFEASRRGGATGYGSFADRDPGNRACSRHGCPTKSGARPNTAMRRSNPHLPRRRRRPGQAALRREVQHGFRRSRRERFQYETYLRRNVDTLLHRSNRNIRPAARQRQCVRIHRHLASPVDTGEA
jgi:hypothetical protein